MLRLNKETKLKKLRAKKPGKKRRRKPINKGGRAEIIVSQLQKVIPNLLLERNKRTLTKLLTSAVIRRVITQKIILSLS